MTSFPSYRDISLGDALAPNPRPGEGQTGITTGTVKHEIEMRGAFATLDSFIRSLPSPLVPLTLRFTSEDGADQQIDGYLAEGVDHRLRQLDELRWMASTHGGEGE